MAKPRGIDAKLARLQSLESESSSAEMIQELRKYLADTSNLVVEKAARIVGSHALSELAPQLVAAIDQLMVDHENSDKQCRGKIAIIDALNKIEYSQPDVFLRGVRHFQDRRFDPLDPGDAAATLRAHSALGLARIGQPGTVLLLTDLLLDIDKRARAGAARALGGTGSLAAVPLLRFKVHIGDPVSDVLGECFSSLLALSPDDSLPFVAHFLKSHNEDVAGSAVFALADTGRSEAFAILEQFWPDASEQLQETVLLGMAMFRLPAALEFLIGIVASKHPAARAALSALAIHKLNTKIKERVSDAVAANGSPDVQQWFKKKFTDA
jgi:HEAT repeat protein